MDIKSCYIGQEISPEEFIPEHCFIYMVQGTMHGYDGNRYGTLRPGQYCLIRKNRLARYNKQPQNGEFRKVIVMLDETFLRSFQEEREIILHDFNCDDTYSGFKKNEKISAFIGSLMPYYIGAGKIDQSVVDSKRQELLTILLQLHPELSGLLFTYGIPDKINLEAFMNRHYKFNVSTKRLAYLTGRSLSSFKRDFKTTFNDSPVRWLMRRRLKEAYFLIDKKRKKATDIYLDLGFEDLSHFSFAFKKHFGVAPTELAGRH